LWKIIFAKGGYMNNITNLLDLEDPDIIISETSIQGQVKTITLETKPVAHFCPFCGLRMYSRGVKERTINHPVLQDGYSLSWLCLPGEKLKS
jgi:hypothetical protein